jgi:rhodanese-related sulfurtransferase
MLATLQYQSVHRLAKLPDEVGLFPTHGEGSFCTASGAGRTTSTIGQEKRENPVLHYPDVESFIEGQLAGLGPYPKYYPNMAPINTFGPTPLPRREVPELSPAELAERGEQVWVVDARPRQRFAAGHLPGAISVELADDFGTWVGWVLPFNAPLQLVLDPDQDLREAVVQLGRIGFDRVEGVLRGLEAWRAEGRPLESFETVDVAGFAAALHEARAGQLLDVRMPAEFEAAHLPGSLHRYAPDLAVEVPAELRADQPVWVACGSGFRATIAASLLQRAGYRPIVLREGGVPDVLDRLETAGSAV